MLLKRAFLLFLILSFHLPVFAAKSNLFACSLSTSIGIRHGVVDELVYDNKKLESKLMWPQTASPFINLDLGFRIWNFLIKTRYSSCISTDCGSLKDFDYLNTQNSQISNYSIHDCSLDKDFSFSGEISFKINVRAPFYKIYPGIGIFYQSRKWTGKDGYYQTPVSAGSKWTGDEEKKYVTGTVACYEQSLWHPYITLKNVICLNKFVLFGTELIYYPYIAIDAVDSHFLRNMQFYDTLHNGSGGRINNWLIIKPFKDNRNIGFKIAFDYEIFTCKGKSYVNSIGEKKSKFIQLEHNTGGSKNCLWELYLSFIFFPNLYD